MATSPSLRRSPIPRIQRSHGVDLSLMRWRRADGSKGGKSAGECKGEMATMCVSRTAGDGGDARCKRVLGSADGP